jgi:hypothetical protein
LIATVDKFASLPWVGQAGALLGGADRADAKGFYGAAEPGKGTRLMVLLPAPDLVIQDELHLISGPLGTMAGLYETAIEALCLREIDGREVGHKIVASTATVRRAQDQIQALFARPLTQVFPATRPTFLLHQTCASEFPLDSTRHRCGKTPELAQAGLPYGRRGGPTRRRRAQDARNPADRMTVIGCFNLPRSGRGAADLEEEVQTPIKAASGRGGAWLFAIKSLGWS